MNFEDFALAVPKIKNLSLPGFLAHLEMVPPERLNLENQQLPKVPKTARKAGVLALCYPDSDQITRILLILRPSYSGVHSAQVALPGGGMEKEDYHLEDTALREAEEEVGLSRSDVKIIRSLSRVYIPPSNYHVTPYLAISDRPLSFKPQPAEVAGIIEVPIAQLLHYDSLIRCVQHTSYAGVIDVPAFSLQGHVVWGATAMIINELRLMLKSI